MTWYIKLIIHNKTSVLVFYESNYISQTKFLVYFDLRFKVNDNYRDNKSFSVTKSTVKILYVYIYLSNNMINNNMNFTYSCLHHQNTIIIKCFCLKGGFYFHLQFFVHSTQWRNDKLLQYARLIFLKQKSGKNRNTHSLQWSLR